MSEHSFTFGPVTPAQAAALVEAASGADSAAIEALESVVANLRRARAARAQLATRVPVEVLRHVLGARSAHLGCTP